MSQSSKLIKDLAEDCIRLRAAAQQVRGTAVRLSPPDTSARDTAQAIIDRLTTIIRFTNDHHRQADAHRKVARHRSTLEECRLVLNQLVPQLQMDPAKLAIAL